MGYNFHDCERGQLLLMPPSLREWLPEGHLAWFILDAVERMDLSGFYAKYRSDGWGGEAFNPSMMVGLLLYAYCHGVRSSREIERHCEENIAYRVLTANQKPDHATVCRFRERHEVELKKLFIEVLRLCVEAGLVKVGKVSLDGTKMKANASLRANRARKQIEQEVERMLSEAAAKDAEEDAAYGQDVRGDELPDVLKERSSRLKRLRECKERLDREREEAREKQRAKIAKREQEAKTKGKKTMGRPPTPPEKIDNPDARANITDPDSRAMKGYHGTQQGYNAQAVVTDAQIIIAADVTQEGNDFKQLKPMMQQAEATRAAVVPQQKIKAARADAGYWTETNSTYMVADGPELFIATIKDRKQAKMIREHPSPRGRIPKHLTPKQRMERKLRTQRGRAIYRTRSHTIEPVFGQIKSCRRCDRFMRRGLPACQSEWAVICATHNILKLWRSGKASWN